MKDADWDIVYKVHLRGSYSVSKAAWNIMREQKFGRIIMTTSAAGIYGNFGQANYSAAKLGISGLANTLAKEGAKRNIFVNTIAPLAGTRLTATVMPPDMVEALKPEYVAPLVAFLCNEESTVNGGLFEVGAGWVSQLRRQRSHGHFFSLKRALTPEDVRANFANIADFSKDTSYPTSPQDSIGVIMGHLDQSKSLPAGSVPPVSERFDNKVVVVTGAGGGLGKAYALEFARRGAKVVVNDLGTSTTGEGAGSSPAEKVCEEIRAAGGEAVANFDSVEYGEKIIKTAMDTWGRVDVVINNAGILRDVSFAKMTDREWDLVNQVHLRGSYSVSKAAWNIMREQKFGRIIMTTSAAGIYGNFGQANYSAAKLGILGLGNTLAIEGAKRNIFVNTIAPVAGTRMTATVMPPDLVEALKPEYIVPLVVHLCHAESDVNGGLFEVGAGWISQVRWERSPGHVFANRPFTAADVAQNWPRIADFSNPTYPTSTQDSMGIVMNALQAAKEGASTSAAAPADEGNEHVKPSRVLAHKFSKSTFTYTNRDVALYALSIGAAENQLDDEELSFVYENHPNFRALPTMGIIPPFAVLGEIMGVDGLSFNPMMLLHGEQYLEVRKPIPVEGTLTNEARISGLYDKGKGVVLVVDALSRDAAGDEVCFNQFTVFIRGIGGYGGERGPKPTSYAPPKRAPDAVHTEKTTDNQALFYRLSSGDLNPLHADPAMAAMGGFDKPILHGMCTYGYAGRAVLKHFCGNDPAKFKSIRARLASSVFPGETLVTEMWKEGSKVLFTVKVQERNKIVINNAVVELAGAASAPSAGPSAGGDFKAAMLFKEVAATVKAKGAELVKRVGCVYEFKSTKGGASQSWTVDLKNGSGSVQDGPPAKADCTVTMADDDMVALFTGKLDPQNAFMGGKLKIKGNMAFAMKLNELMKARASL
eukprot:TRINITY_DN146_c0_g1_i1.p1 TRINITY_DN146_c0_g1~~TRINITY_DN146_c0_g1_i1.p1  ORF type:complete len:1053 (+),score=460.20 TRINITY_DN146_c0_g1_i1:365-3160(+)